MTVAGKQSRIAKLVERRIHDLKGRKSQKDIADEAGYANQNMITMLKLGTAKVALDRVPGLARALEVDPIHLFRLAVEQFFTEKTMGTMTDIIGPLMVSKNELEILNLIRDVSTENDPQLSDKLRKAITSALT